MPRMAALLSVAALAVGLIVGTAGSAQAAPAAAPSVVTPDPSGYVEIFPPLLAPAKCLDDPNGTNRIGTQIQIFHCHGYASNGAPQRWNFAPVGFDVLGRQLYEVFNKAGKGCIGAPSTNFGSAVIMDICNGDLEEEWTVQSLFNADRFLLVNAHTGLCMTADNLSGADHTAIEVWPCVLDSEARLQAWQLG